MSFNSSWIPDESALDLWNERSNFVGAILESTGYGCHLMLYFFAVRSLMRRADKVAWWSLAYITTMIVLDTVSNALDIKYNEMVFIDYRNYSGPSGTGPVAFLTDEYNAPVEVAGLVFYFLGQWFQDGLLLYRFFVIFGSSYIYVSFPILMFIATVIFDCLLLSQISQPLANIWQHTSVIMALPAYSISIALNIILTVSICLRLLAQRNSLKGTSMSGGSLYTSLIGMLVESAALYTVFAVGFIICYAQGSLAQNIFLALLPSAQGMAPTLIIMRVAERRHMNNTLPVSAGATGSRFTSGHSGTAVSKQIQFGTNPGLTSQGEMEMKGYPYQVERTNHVV